MRSLSPRLSRKKETPTANQPAPLLDRYEPAEPRLLRTGRLGPVLRAKDQQAKTLVSAGALARLSADEVRKARLGDIKRLFEPYAPEPPKLEQ